MSTFKNEFSNTNGQKNREKGSSQSSVTLNRAAEIALGDGHLTKAIQHANEALELLIQETDESHYINLAHNHLIHSKIYLAQKDFNQANNFVERGLQICEERNFDKLISEGFLISGKISFFQKDYISAILYFLAARSKASSNQQAKQLTESILFIGKVYTEVFHYEKALENFRQLEINDEIQLDRSNQLGLLNYLGKAHFYLFQYDSAMIYFKEAEQLAQQSNDKTALVFCQSYIGMIHARQEEYNRALRYAKKVNHITEEIGDAYGLQINLINLGNIHNKLEKYSEGIKLTSRGIAAAKRMKDGLSEIRGYQIMAEIFRKQKDYKSAVMYQMIYTKFYEDFYQRNDRLKVIEIEYDYTIKQLRQQVEQLKKKQAQG